MSWVKAASGLQRETVVMEELVKQMVQANLQQQETNRLLGEQILALRETVMAQPPLPRETATTLVKVRQTVQSTMQKMTAADDVEAFLTMFERMAGREKLPLREWAEVLAPFLVGEPQKAYFDLTPEQANDYPLLKAEILARLGVTVSMRARRVHGWRYEKSKPPRSQLFDLLHLARKWLQPEVLTPREIVERVVMDRYMSSLPKELYRWVAQGEPQTLDQMVSAVERYTSTEEFLAPEQKPRPPEQGWEAHPAAEKGKPVPRTRVTEWSRGGKQKFKPLVSGTSPFQSPIRGRPDFLCWRCQQPGHIAAHCPQNVEPMDCSVIRRSSLFAYPACSADPRQDEGLQERQVLVNGAVVIALLDSGSLVTLLRAAVPHVLVTPERRVGVICVHGDTKHYPVAKVIIETDCGAQYHEVAVVNNLMHAFIIGRDFPLFWELLAHKSTRAKVNNVNNVSLHPVPLSKDMPIAAVQVIGEGTEDFPLAVLAGEEGEPSGPEASLPDLEVSRDNFGTAQMRDLSLKRAFDSVAVINGVPQGRNTDKCFPHFALNQDLLYRVTQIRETLVEQLVVPGPYRRMILDMAHTHVLGGHLGTDKTQERILQRFYWPGCYKEIGHDLQ